MTTAFKKKVKGYIMLQAALAILCMGMAATCFFTIMTSNFSSISASKTALQAQQYAEIAADTLKLYDYDSLNSAKHSRKAIDDTNGEWQDEIIIGDEKKINADSENKMRIATINIYKPGDTLTRYSMKVPLSSQGSGGGVPIGTVIAWPLAVLPSGSDKDKWLECNGQAIDATKYPKLAALMSYTPNYAGVFLRGYGSQYSYHYGTVLHSSAALGALQGDAAREIQGEFNSNINNLSCRFASGAFLIGANISDGDGYTGAYGETYRLKFSSSYTTPVSNENRPVNVAVKYLIKAK
jgi:hypothetical protein